MSDFPHGLVTTPWPGGGSILYWFWLSCVFCRKQTSVSLTVLSVTQDVDTMLVYCWSSVVDDGPTLNQSNWVLLVTKVKCRVPIRGGVQSPQTTCCLEMNDAAAFAKPYLNVLKKI